MKKLKKRVRDAQDMTSLMRYSVQSCSSAAEAECKVNCDAAAGGGTTYYTKDVFLADRTHKYKDA